MATRNEDSRTVFSLSREKCETLAFALSAACRMAMAEAPDNLPFKENERLKSFVALARALPVELPDVVTEEPLQGRSAAERVKLLSAQLSHIGKQLRIIADDLSPADGTQPDWMFVEADIPPSHLGLAVHSVLDTEKLRALIYELVRARASQFDTKP